MRKLHNKENIRILATLGPSSLKKPVVHKMDEFGVDVFRVNLSHTKISDLESIIKKVSDWTSKTLCLDTEGAQIRTAKFKNGQVEIKENSRVLLTASNSLETNCAFLYIL